MDVPVERFDPLLRGLLCYDLVVEVEPGHWLLRGLGHWHLRDRSGRAWWPWRSDNGLRAPQCSASGCRAAGATRPPSPAGTRDGSCTMPASARRRVWTRRREPKWRLVLARVIPPTSPIGTWRRASGRRREATSGQPRPADLGVAVLPAPWPDGRSGRGGGSPPGNLGAEVTVMRRLGPKRRPSNVAPPVLHPGVMWSRVRSTAAAGRGRPDRGDA